MSEPEVPPFDYKELLAAYRRAIVAEQKAILQLVGAEPGTPEFETLFELWKQVVAAADKARLHLRG